MVLIVLSRIICGLLLNIGFLITYSHANTYNTGEVNFGEYYGPVQPLFSVNKYSRELIFKDEYDSKLYFSSRLNLELFLLDDFFYDEFRVGNYCPDSELRNVQKYYTYLSRLLTISYLFEAFREFEYSTRLLGGKNSCIVNWKQEFKRCRPKTNQMKLFLKNLKHPLKKIKNIHVSFDNGKKSSIKKWITQVRTNKPISLGQIRLGQFCKKNKCSLITSKDSLHSFDLACKKDLQLLQRVCSESDHLYGLSYVSELYPLLLRSNAMRAVESQSYQAGCLRRFIQLYKNHEDRYQPLKQIYSYLYSFYRNEKSLDERGRLFSIGALKEFFNKGLSEVFDTPPKRKMLKKTIKKMKVSKVPSFEQITLPEFVQVKIKKKKDKLVKITKKNIIRKSAFLIASEFRTKFSLSTVEVDMRKFKYDYTFTLSQENNFNIIVKKFSSQKSLKEMKFHDKLGTEKAPIPLRFIKYLIDKEMHQGLFNIIYVLGSGFYVRNDIDLVQNPSVEMISIRNDQSTQYKWKLSILKKI